jgi:hypothetical protein
MIDFILEKFTEIASNCLERNAKEFNAKKEDMQLVFKLSQDKEEVEYLICKEYKTQKVITFLQVLGVKLDFKGYSLFVPKFIKGALERFCKEDSIDADKVKVLLNFNTNKELIIWVYNGNQYVKQIELESLFDGEDMLTK